MALKNSFSTMIPFKRHIGKTLNEQQKFYCSPATKTSDADLYGLNLTTN